MSNVSIIGSHTNRSTVGSKRQAKIHNKKRSRWQPRMLARPGKEGDGPTPISFDLPKYTFNPNTTSKMRRMKHDFWMLSASAFKKNSITLANWIRDIEGPPFLAETWDQDFTFCIRNQTAQGFHDYIEYKRGQGGSPWWRPLELRKNPIGEILNSTKKETNDMHVLIHRHHLLPKHLRIMSIRNFQCTWSQPFFISAWNITPT